MRDQFHEFLENFKMKTASLLRHYNSQTYPSHIKHLWDKFCRRVSDSECYAMPLATRKTLSVRMHIFSALVLHRCGIFRMGVAWTSLRTKQLIPFYIILDNTWCFHTIQRRISQLFVYTKCRRGCCYSNRGKIRKMSNK